MKKLLMAALFLTVASTAMAGAQVEIKPSEEAPHLGLPTRAPAQRVDLFQTI